MKTKSLSNASDNLILIHLLVTWCSILLRSTEWSKIKANMPWLLDAVVCVALDLFVSFHSTIAIYWNTYLSVLFLILTYSSSLIKTVCALNASIDHITICLLQILAKEFSHFEWQRIRRSLQGSEQELNTLYGLAALLYTPVLRDKEFCGYFFVIESSYIPVLPITMAFTGSIIL